MTGSEGCIRVLLTDSELSGKPGIHRVSQGHVAEQGDGDEGPVDRRERHHAEIGSNRGYIGNGRTDGDDREC